ncbi:hypothetical protein SAMN04515666_101312 [Bosea lupini]|uniref:Uncharacterized protein n=1 Tax=Bosea lupini TaxID=1036779 RepID=A0A1H7GBU1_9HYPH|nr:hypothetical protein [Bosea lupini]SEK35591.1 hypothetical protein SAMN04515666_101312 [Bosea lupini]
MSQQLQADAEFAIEHRCRDFDEDCAEVPGPTPDGDRRTYLDCWLHDPTQGWCPFLRHCGGKEGEGL